MNLDFFGFLNKSPVAYLHRCIYVSYKYIEGSEIKDYMSNRHDQLRVCRRAYQLGGRSSLVEKKKRSLMNVVIADKIGNCVDHMVDGETCLLELPWISRLWFYAMDLGKKLPICAKAEGEVALSSTFG